MTKSECRKKTENQNDPRRNKSPAARHWRLVAVSTFVIRVSFGFRTSPMNDLRYAVRMLLKNPAFTAIAVLTLALGIGANTAIFSFVNAILLRPLPYQEPERLVMVFENHRVNGWSKNSVGAPVLGEWRKQSTVFDGLAARGSGGFILTGKRQPENVPGSFLSANIFALLGLKPILGRDFLPEEETYGKHHVVLLS